MHLVAVDSTDTMKPQRRRDVELTQVYHAQDSKFPIPNMSLTDHTVVMSLNNTTASWPRKQNRARGGVYFLAPVSLRLPA